MEAKLTEPDRRSVDYLLSGEPHEQNTGESPLVRGAFLDRVNSARRVLGMLDAMPVQEPPTSLADATMRKIAAAQALASQKTPPSTSANL